MSEKPRVYMDTRFGRGRIEGGRYDGVMLDCRCTDRVFIETPDRPEVVVTATLYMCYCGGWLKILTTNFKLKPGALLDITDVVYRSAINKATNELREWLHG